jgi:60 kDa SS-A/Ro ribonucleoprotein
MQMPMKNLAAHLSTKVTPQTAPIPGRETEMVRNEAGGFAFPVDDWVRLDRFLILGSEGGAYYATERELTLESAACVVRCVHEDGARTVARIVLVSASGRAPKNDAALLALAIAAKRGDDATRTAALEALPLVARTSTHLFAFAEALEQLAGWGRGTRRAVADWYRDRGLDALSYQAVKYRQRNGWTHADMLRLAHAQPPTPDHDRLFRWIVKGELPEDTAHFRLLEGFTRVQAATSAKEAAQIVAEYRLPREAVPTGFLDAVEVWQALLVDMPITALIRNLGTMTRVGLLTPRAKATKDVVERIGDRARLRKGRVHPMAVLIAMRTYAAGRGLRGRHTWEPVQKIVDALDAAFYATFENVEPTGKRVLVALDCSGSMSGGSVAGVRGLPPREAAAAMALIALRTEPNAEVLGFTTNVKQLRISPRKRLDDAVKAIASVAKGEGTDCSIPMRWAAEQKADFDALTIYTDGQTWAGPQHPVQAMAAYRAARVHDAKMVSVAFAGYSSSVVDGADAGMLDVVGFDTAAPMLIADFLRQGMRAEGAGSVSAAAGDEA